MRRLLLMRHGKSGWDSEDQNDFDRVLSPEGQADSKAAANWILAHDLTPDRVMFSDACRTSQTCEIVTRQFPAVPASEGVRDLYLASPGTLLATIEKLAEDVGCALVIGHNPGLESLARLMAGPGSDARATENLARGFPPAGLAVIELNGNAWRTMSAEGGRLTDFLRPMTLEDA
jgi:phosphohistidine phosphatase